jgi:hypothetical protein
MALWVFGPADCGVSISRLDTPPSCTIVFLAYTQSLRAVHTLCRRRRFVPEYNHGGWPVLQPRRFILWFERPSGAAYAATTQPAISLSVDVCYEMFVSFTLMLYNVRSAVLLSQQTHVWGKLLLMWAWGPQGSRLALSPRGYESWGRLLSHN